MFRFEYYYLLKNGNFSDIPWINSTHSSVSGMQDVAAIVVDIAVIDPKSKVLLTNAPVATSLSTISQSDERNWLITLLGIHPVGCAHSGRTHSTLTRLCRDRRFPVSGCTNALFTSLRLSNDYFAS